MKTIFHLPLRHCACWIGLCMFFLTSCRKSDDILTDTFGELGGAKSFSNCNLPVTNTISVATYGAVPNDGVDDTQAFILASQAVNAACNSGGTTLLMIPSGTYDVGKQLTPGQSWTVGTQTFTNPVGSGMTHRGVDIITITCCPNVLIKGTGSSRLRFHDGMSFGWNGACTQKADVGVMVNIQGTKCATVTGLELDGNNSNCNLLTPCVDAYQLAYDGILAHSSTYLDINNVYTHHHGRDGLMLYKRQIVGCTYSTNMQYIHLTNLKSEHNSRQGFSWTDGQDLTAEKCIFSHTGSVFYNNPGAGLDIEPDNGGTAARGVFNFCKFERNRVWGVISDNHPTTVWDIKFNECSIWHNSTGGAAIWVTRGNQFLFNKSKIYGTIIHAGGVSSTQRVLFTANTITDIGPDLAPCPLFQNTLLHEGPADSFFEFNGNTFDLNNNMLAFVETLNAPPPYTNRKFASNVFRLRYATLSCSGTTNVPTVFCGGGNACNGSRYLGYFRNCDWTRNQFIDTNPLTVAEPNNKNYLIQIGNNAGVNSFRNTMDGTNTFQYVAGSNVGHFLRQLDPANGCWGSRAVF